jgi:threonine dehydrogenase-like Zn-dependent dehydrogenase
MSLPKTMRAVVLKGDYEVAVEDRPVPTIKNPTDVILKVTSTALCGSDLHYYRGHLKCPPGFICGHEFVGEIVEKGSAVSKFKKGDRVVVPFYTACGECELSCFCNSNH